MRISSMDNSPKFGLKVELADRASKRVIKKCLLETLVNGNNLISKVTTDERATVYNEIIQNITSMGEKYKEIAQNAKIDDNEVLKVKVRFKKRFVNTIRDWYPEIKTSVKGTKDKSLKSCSSYTIHLWDIVAAKYDIPKTISDSLLNLFNKKQLINKQIAAKSANKAQVEYERVSIKRFLKD